VLAFGLLLTAVLYAALLKRLALQQANQTLAAEDESRRAFFAEASHELRMPLTIIRGEAQIALRNQGEAHHDTVEALGRILDQTRAVSRVLDDLFLIARAAAGGLTMSMRRLDAGQLVRQTACEFSTLASEYGATMQCRADLGLEVMADAGRLRQALAALIDNALRHTRKGVALLVEGYRDGSQVVLAVSDDGPGIDPAMAQQLFQRFRRGHTRSEGSGLGLAVVRALAIAHRGSVVIERSSGGGARVCIALPACEESAARTEVDGRGEGHEFTTAG
jgi:signal transduction histidine kinase